MDFPELVWLIWLAAASGGSTMAEVLYAKYSVPVIHLTWAFRWSPPVQHLLTAIDPYDIHPFCIFSAKAMASNRAPPLSSDGRMASESARVQPGSSDPGMPFHRNKSDQMTYSHAAISKLHGTNNLHPSSCHHASCWAIFFFFAVYPTATATVSSAVA